MAGRRSSGGTGGGGWGEQQDAVDSWYDSRRGEYESDESLILLPRWRWNQQQLGRKRRRTVTIWLRLIIGSTPDASSQ